MSSPARLLACLLAVAAAQCAAQVTALPPASVASAPAQTLTRTVVEDDGARIEETRLRGAPHRITVQSKIGAVAPYEILVGPAGRDASQQRGTTGQRAWSVLSF